MTPPKGLTEQELMVTLEQILSEARRQDPGMPLQTFLTLVEIYLHPGSSFVELSERMDMGHGSISRNVAYLTTEHWTKKKPGLDLVYVEEDAEERRRKNIYLNDRGRNWISRLNTLVNDRIGATNR